MKAGRECGAPLVLLRSTPRPAMMPVIMSEQTEPIERTANEQTEQLTFAEAAERLNISVDAVRMRVRRGRLTTIQANNRTFVVWPQPEQVNEQRTEPNRSDNRSSVRVDSRVIAALEAHIASLERQLTERTEEIRRRDHIIAGLVERVKELPATVEMPQDANAGPSRGNVVVEGSEAVKPTSDSLALSWRRWWRRVRGG